MCEIFLIANRPQRTVRGEEAHRVTVAATIRVAAVIAGVALGGRPAAATSRTCVGTAHQRAAADYITVAATVTVAAVKFISGLALRGPPAAISLAVGCRVAATLCIPCIHQANHGIML